MNYLHKNGILQIRGPHSGQPSDILRPLFFGLLIILVSCRTVTELEGEWEQDCRQKLRSTMQFSGQNFELHWRVYLEENCKTLMGEIDGEGQFSIGSAGTTTQGTLYKNADFFDLAATLTLTNPLAVAFYNYSKECGYDDWEQDESIDITDCKEMNVPAAYYEIFLVEEDTLFTGDRRTGDATTETSRPTELNLDVPYLRVAD